jgi:hypothetical protein
MGLKRKLDDGDWALLEVIEDPVWCGEFLRSTGDCELDKALWPEHKFKYRDYQRQVLTDQTEFIVYTGGRAIGKCQPAGSRVYTTEGYQKISELIKKRYFVVYCLDKYGHLEKRRAICVNDQQKPCYTIITEDGHSVVGTDNHPILTPHGYVPISELSNAEYIAVVSKLPWDSSESALRWHELRYLGYTLFDEQHKVEKPIKAKFRRIEKELELIADQFLSNWHKDEFHNFYFTKKPGPFRHNISVLLEHAEISIYNRPFYTKLPPIIMLECLENIQIFLEALFAQFGDLYNAPRQISLEHALLKVLQDVQELLLRFSIESSIKQQDSKYILTIADYHSAYTFWSTFKLPGVSVAPLQKPQTREGIIRYSKIDRIYKSHEMTDTYAIHVYEHNNYISDNILVHNSIVLQDKIVHEIINCDKEFPRDSLQLQEVLVTPNRSQQVPFMTAMKSRFLGKRFLKHYLQGNINMSDGTMKFPIAGREFLFHFRIAGTKGESNMVSLHVPKIRGDEAQLFPMEAYRHLQGAYNAWAEPKQQLWLGVTQGLRNTVLYYLDQKNDRYKKYRIPSHNNPYYSRDQDIENIKKAGGEEADEYQQMWLGRHGSAAFQVITRDDIKIETYPITNNRYFSTHKLKGIHYTDQLVRPVLPVHSDIVLAVDPAFSDYCIMQILCKDKHGFWRTYVRYRLQRIDFVEQEKIIDWIATHYHINKVIIDLGAGGNGAAIVHGLMHRDDYKGKQYDKRVIGVQFSEQIVVGYDDQNNELTQDAKSYAAEELAKLIHEGVLVFSEIDQEGISQMERITKKKLLNGKNQYFILTDNGRSKSDDDHIFASYICFVLGIRSAPQIDIKRKLGKPSGVMTK